MFVLYADNGTGFRKIVTAFDNRIEMLEWCCRNKYVTFDGVSYENGVFEAEIILKDGYHIEEMTERIGQHG